MLKKILVIAFIIIWIYVPCVIADVVRPSDRVVNGVNIRSQPNSQSPSLGLLIPGEELPYLGSVPRWNIVRTTGGQNAYVSKSWTKVVAESSTGDFTVHIVDVGTGLAIIVQGADFTLIYDGGSNDDMARGTDNRLLSYLKSMDISLAKIDYLILSHPHRDHVELLPDLFDEYDINHVWESGRAHTICGYRAFLKKVSVEPGVAYHTTISNFGNVQVSFGDKSCYGNDLPEELISINSGGRIDDTSITLGSGASMRFLHADAYDYSKINRNSLIVKLDLGQLSLLLMGDAEGGSRSSEQDDPTAQSIEGKLLECCKSELKADILVVGHHGSKSSSRTTFLDAVDADIFIVSSGPKKYGSVVLPDSDVISKLQNRGTVYRTDVNDTSCLNNTDKIGPDNDGKPGGCDNIRIAISSDGIYSTSYWTGSD